MSLAINNNTLSPIFIPDMGLSFVPGLTPILGADLGLWFDSLDAESRIDAGQISVVFGGEFLSASDGKAALKGRYPSRLVGFNSAGSSLFSSDVESAIKEVQQNLESNLSASIDCELLAYGGISVSQNGGVRIPAQRCALVLRRESVVTEVSGLISLAEGLSIESGLGVLIRGI